MHWNMCSAEVKPDTVPVLRRSTAPLMRWFGRLSITHKASSFLIFLLMRILATWDTNEWI
jgi:hypothetical protein